MNEMRPEKEVTYIRTLGGFSIQYGNRQISDADGRTKKVWLLLEFLVSNRGKDISMEQLAEAIWRDEDESENPGNALKNLVYRARMLLKKLRPDVGEEYIVFSRNSYVWNWDFPCVVDVEEFEKYYRQGDNVKNDDNSRIQAYLKAMEIYKGEFLPKSSYADWVISQSAYYTSLYEWAVGKTVKLLRMQKRYTDIVNVCESAVVLYPFEESFHYELLRGLIDSGKYRKAIAHYEYLTDFFYKKMGVALSDPIRELYQTMLKGVESGEAGMDAIVDELKELEEPQAAFYCDYEIFKQIYRLQARSIARTGLSVHIALFTVKFRSESMAESSLIKGLMDSLRESIMGSLRKGDVVSTFSTTQLVVMLPMTSYENGETVIHRVLANFSRHHRNRDYYVEAKLRDITPSAY